MYPAPEVSIEVVERKDIEGSDVGGGENHRRGDPGGAGSVERLRALCVQIGRFPMKKFLQSSLVLSVSLVTTLVVLALVLPMHPRLGTAAESPSSAVVPALFIPGLHASPGVLGPADSGESAAPLPRTGCPYLDSKAAAGGCPEFPGVSGEKACPYLGDMRREAEVEKPRTLRGQHT